MSLCSIGNVQIAPEKIAVWNPGFDVTYSSLIHGIITEIGVATHHNCPGEDDPHILDMAMFMKMHSIPTASNAVKPSRMHVRYTRLSEADVIDYLVREARFCRLLDVAEAASLQEKKDRLAVREVGDGNVNYVYIVQNRSNPLAALVVKQALPYVRCVGEDWPLTLERAHFEFQALEIEHQLCPDHVPELYSFDESKSIIVMRFIEPPHVILRKNMVAQVRNEHVVDHIAKFLAATLVGTSGIVLSGPELRRKVEKWSKNTGMCGLTEQVIFTDPYYPAKFNHWERVAPHLTHVIEQGIYKDAALHKAVAVLKEKFLSLTQALVHGDLHTGSVMVSHSTTFVIDPEFAFYGPMGFDTGLFVANWLMSYCAHHTPQDNAESTETYGSWLLSQLIRFYSIFETLFVAQWNNSPAGVWFDENVFPRGSSSLESAQKLFMEQLWKDTLGFAGAEMIRRIVGIAHVQDLETGVERVEDRVRAQYLTLLMGRRLILASCGQEGTHYSSMNDVVADVLSFVQDTGSIIYKEPAAYSWP